MQMGGLATEARDLSDQMVETIGSGPPITWGELARRLGVATDSPALIAATRRRRCADRIIIAAPSGKPDPTIPPEALVFRVEDLERVARSTELWRLALRYLRGRATHLHTVGELRAVFKPTPLKMAFGAALATALANRTLPAGVAAVLRRGHFYLLLQDDLLTPPESVPRRTNGRAVGFDSMASEDRAQNDHPTGDESFADAFEREFSRLDAESGRKNFVKLLRLREALPQFSRTVFDRELNALRRAGRFSLDAAEGTHDRTTPEERDAGVVEAGRRLLYCARR